MSGLTIIAPDLEELRVMLKDLTCLEVKYIPFQKGTSSLKIIVLLTKTILFRKYDLIHSHGFTAGVYSALVARIKRTKHIMTAHDVLLPDQISSIRGFIKKTALNIFLPMIDVIHSVSNDARDNLLSIVPKLRKKSNACIMISNGIEVERFQVPEKRNFHEELCLPLDIFFIGFLGRFMSQKGFLYLVEAIELLLKERDLKRKPIILAIGSGGFIREEKIYLKKRGLENHFHFIPFVPNITPILKGIDVVVMPSLWEACPLLAMETMVAGTPFIGTDCIGLREILNNTPGIMVPTRNSLLLAIAIKEEINNSSRFTAEAFSREAAKRFDVKNRAAELEKATLKLIKQR